MQYPELSYETIYHTDEETEEEAWKGYVAHSMSHIHYITEIEFLFRLS